MKMFFRQQIAREKFFSEMNKMDMVMSVLLIIGIRSFWAEFAFEKVNFLGTPL